MFECENCTECKLFILLEVKGVLLFTQEKFMHTHTYTHTHKYPGDDTKASSQKSALKAALILQFYGSNEQYIKSIQWGRVEIGVW